MNLIFESPTLAEKSSSEIFYKNLMISCDVKCDSIRFVELWKYTALREIIFFSRIALDITSEQEFPALPDVGRRNPLIRGSYEW